ncbi:hypothetical protein [Paenibacillus sp. FSL R7-0273]|nr:hypothetical protein [Paenibacillus sp. FSL R7-0273]
MPNYIREAKNKTAEHLRSLIQLGGTYRSQLRDASVIFTYVIKEKIV